MKAFRRKAIQERLAQTLEQRLIHWPLWVLSRLHLLPVHIWSRLPVTFEFEVVLAEAESFRYRGEIEDGIARALYWNPGGSWEWQTLRVFRSLAKTSRVVLDIGAHTGVYSLLACAVNAHSKVIAVEPCPVVYRLLQRNIMINGFSSRIQPLALAASSMKGFSKLYVPAKFLTMATLRPDGWGGVLGDPIEVPCATVDSICSEILGESVDLIKMDVEGWEDRVLQGSQEVLAKDSPVLIIECAPEGPLKEVGRILSTFSYRFFSLHDAVPQRIDALAADQIKTQQWNVLCVPESKLEVLDKLAAVTSWRISSRGTTRPRG